MTFADVFVAALASAERLIAVSGAAGCEVDTELGIAADVTSAQVTVTGAGADSIVGVDLVVHFRVGEHAQGVRTFIVPQADLFSGTEFLAQITLARPPDFDGMLAPGEDETVSIHGETRPGDFAGARDPLCAPQPTITVLLRWRDQTTAELGASQAMTSAVTCD